MKNKNWFWGLIFLLATVFVLFGQTWLPHDISIISIIATVFLVLIAIRSILRLEYFGFFISLSVLYIIYSKPFNLMYISPWLLISSAILISISFYMLFSKWNKKTLGYNDVADQRNQSSEKGDDSNPYAKVVLASSSKYLHSECLQRGHFISYLGVLEVYFDQVQTDIDGAEVFIDNIIGTIYIYIPRNWNVVNNIDSYLGYISNNNENTKPSENAAQLRLSGRVILGNVEIRYI